MFIYLDYNMDKQKAVFCMSLIFYALMGVAVWTHFQLELDNCANYLNCAVNAGCHC